MNNQDEEIQNYKSLYKEEESQLQFAESFGYHFKVRMQRILTLFVQGSLRRYNEVLIQKIQIGNDQITVQVVKPM